MRLSLTSLLRPLLWAAMGMTLIAIGLGRSVPRPLAHRQPAAPRYHGVDGRFFTDADMHPRFLDLETGGVLGIALRGEEKIDHAVCSPWRDDHGQFQVASRWTNRTGHGAGNVAFEFGLARCTLPEGRVIDRVALDLMPMGKPCWVPGLASEIAFVAGDGMIYRYAFEEAD